MATTTGRNPTSALARKIGQFRNDSSGERNLYPFVRDLLTNASFGIGLKSDQIVVDSALAGGRDIPDPTVFSTKGGRAIKTPDHAYGVFEVKRGRDVCDNAAARRACRFGQSLRWTSRRLYVFDAGNGRMGRIEAGIIQTSAGGVAASVPDEPLILKGVGLQPWECDGYEHTRCQAARRVCGPCRLDP